MSYKTYAFLIGYIICMVFLLGEIEEYSIDSEIKNTELQSHTLTGYLSIFFDMLTFSINAGTEGDWEVPFWFNLLINIPIYAMILFLLQDMVNPFLSGG